MLTKEHTILQPFIKKPWKKFTRNNIKEIAHNKSDNYVHTVLKRFVASDILREEKIGNSIAYSLQNNTISLNTIGFIAEYNATISKHIPHKNIQTIIDKLKTVFYILIVTGSYAKKKQKNTSDLDIVIICDNKQEPNALLAQIKLEAELLTPEIHPYVFTQEQFHQMLTTKEENYGKEIARNNLIITGGKEYYSILLEAITRGFNG